MLSKILDWFRRSASAPVSVPLPVPAGGTIYAVTDQLVRSFNSNGYGAWITGTISVNGNTYRFGNGGNNRGSIPFGTYKVGEFLTGAQRKARGHSYTQDAYYLNDTADDAPGTKDDADPTRRGLLIHADLDGKTSGCIGIMGGREVWERFVADMKAAGVTQVVLGPISSPLVKERHDTFKTALAEVLRYEGGKDDDPHDPGGRTAYGVIQRVYDAWRAEKGLPKRDVWLITSGEIEVIYRERYWNRVAGDEHHPAVSFALFNFCVNAGVVQATKDAQRVLGVQVDGKIGPETLDALMRADPRTFVVGYAARQRIFYPKLKTYWRFGKGWMNRVDMAEKFALSLI